MLWTPVNQFNWSVNNFGDVAPGVAGTQLTADGAAHTKGTDTAVLAGVAEDVYGMAITVSSAATNLTIRRQMIDLLVDPAAGVGNAGSSWSVKINNIYTNSASAALTGTVGHNFYFPVFLKAGTAIGAAYQDVVGASTCRFSIRCYGKPTHPELIKVGQTVQTLGANTAATNGIAFTPGNAAYGSWGATHGTLTRDAWFWQLGLGSSDTSMTANIYRLDISAVSAGSVMCLRNLLYHVAGASEESGKVSFGEGFPIANVSSGSDVYVRAWAGAAPDGTFTSVVYAVS